MAIALHGKAHKLTGRRFGRLVAIEPVERRRYNGATQIVWLCRCECGSEARVVAGNLRNGIASSCGCLRSEMTSKKNRTHGKSEVAEYRVWADIKKRCLNENSSHYQSYGGRGIFMCAEWIDDFDRFLSDVGPRPSSQHWIERKDNDGPYSPENCVWATQLEQANNKRSTFFIEAFGRRQSCAQWAREVGMEQKLLRSRIVQHGWAAERALTAPSGPQGRKRG